MASPMEKSTQLESIEAKSVHHYVYPSDDEYTTANEGFEGAKAKSSTRYKPGTIQCSEAQPFQDSEDKPVRFTHFKRLSQETQQAIWRFAVEAVGPRVVEIWQGYGKESPNGEYPWPWTGEFTSPCPIPSVLHACSDSRRVALERWKLCFAFKTQPAKIFFDFTSDILYFGSAFDCMSTFREEGDRADRKTVHKIAFHRLQQWDSEYYETGRDLAVRLHRDFPALNEVVLVEKDVEYDWDRHEMGRAQKRPNPRKTVVSFCPPSKDPGPEDRTADRVMAKYNRKKWACPKVYYMDYERSRPYKSGRPLKPSDDADDEAWDDYFMKLEDAGEDFSHDELSSDDEDWEAEGWLDEVPDLQMRMMLQFNPEFRSYYGF